MRVSFKWQCVQFHSVVQFGRFMTALSGVRNCPKALISLSPPLRTLRKRSNNLGHPPCQSHVCTLCSKPSWKSHHRNAAAPTILKWQISCHSNKQPMTSRAGRRGFEIVEHRELEMSQPRWLQKPTAIPNPEAMAVLLCGVLGVYGEFQVWWIKCRYLNLSLAAASLFLPAVRRSTCGSFLWLLIFHLKLWMLLISQSSIRCS